MISKIKFILLLSLLSFSSAFSAVIEGRIYLVSHAWDKPNSSLPPVANADVLLLGTSFITRADSQGNYRLTDVPPGLYVIAVLCENFWGGNPMIVVNSDTVHVDGTLAAGDGDGEPCLWPVLKFAGKVTDARTGKTIPRAFLHSEITSNGCGWMVTWADQAGQYTWKLDVEPESVSVWAPGYRILHKVVHVYPPDPGVMIHTQDFELIPVNDSSVPEKTSPAALLPDGTLLRWCFETKTSLQGLPVAHCFLDVNVLDDDKVMAKEDRPELPGVYIWIHELGHGAWTGANGSFCVGPINPGTYTVTPMKLGYLSLCTQPCQVVVPAPSSPDSFSHAEITLKMESGRI